MTHILAGSGVVFGGLARARVGWGGVDFECCQGDVGWLGGGEGGGLIFIFFYFFYCFYFF